MGAGVEPLGVEAPVELVGAPGQSRGEEAPVVLVPALGAGTMPGGEGGGLVEKEEPGVAARRHRFAPAASELEPAGDPPAAVVVTEDPAVRSVQTAAVAEHEPSLARLDQLPEWCDAVLQRHQITGPILPHASGSQA